MGTLRTIIHAYVLIRILKLLKYIICDCVFELTYMYTCTHICIQEFQCVHTSTYAFLLLTLLSAD